MPHDKIDQGPRAYTAANTPTSVGVMTPPPIPMTMITGTRRVGEFRTKLLPVSRRVFFGWTGKGLDPFFRIIKNHDHEAAANDKTRNDSPEEEPSYRNLRRHAIDDEIDARRDNRSDH